MRLTATVILCTTLAACGSGNDPTEAVTQSPSSQTQGVSYQVVETWSLPNGGAGRTLVVDPSMRNRADMLILANQLKLETAGDRNAFVFIFDDASAAANRKKAITDELGQAESKHFDQHLIASYQRNIATGHHALHLTLDGADGAVNQIDF